MKKKNIILVGLLSLSLLTGCTTDKIERSQQDIKQEKVEKAKKEIANENKKGKASSTKIITPNSSESTQIESTQTESSQTGHTQAESLQGTYSTTTTQSHQYDKYCTCDSCVSKTKQLQDEYKNNQSNENIDRDYSTMEQQGYPISCAPAWWRECNANGHKATQGLNTQTGNYCWRCIDCNKGVGYEICKDHNTPATPEHMQLHLN